MRRPPESALLPFLALLLGAASVPSFSAGPWFPLAWLSLGGLFVVLRRAATPGSAGRIGLAWGLGCFLVGVSWVFVSLHDFGGMPMLLAALATLLFCTYLALFPAAAALLFAKWRRRDFWRDAALFAGLWTILEWTRGWLLTGFPWLAAGYSQAPPSPLAGYAPVLGVFGVSLLTVLVASGLSEWALRWAGSGFAVSRSLRAQACSAFPLLAAASLLAGGDILRDRRWTEPLGAPIRVALLQGNIPQDLKWQPERFVDSMLTYYQLARDHPAQLTILPETALPAFFDSLPTEFRKDLEQLALRNQGDLLLGSVVGDAGRYTNSVVSLGRSPQQRYSKSHLVPFGEFVPPGLAWLLTTLHIPMSEFSRGPGGQEPLAVGGQQVAVNICYEDVFGEELLSAVPRATLLVNVSNTAWFGRSWAQEQHLQIARMRAMETGRPMLRATNTGMTAIVGPDGKVEDVLPPFVRGALVREVRGFRGETPFVAAGNTAALVLALALALAGALPRRAPGRVSGS